MKTFLHVGYPKTGTTSLQETLYKDSGILAASGIIYPDVGVFQGRHANLAWSCMKLGPWAASRYNGKSTDEMIGEIGRQISKVDRVETMIISSEDLSYQRPHRYAPLIEGLNGLGDVEGVVYLRPQVEAFESMYKQIVRNRGYTETFDVFIEEALTESVGEAPYGSDGLSGWGGSLPPYDYHRFVTEWAEVIPGGRIRVAEYGASAKADIIGDFFEKIGVPRPRGLTERRRSNQSIDGDFLELLRRANQYVPKGVRHKLAADVAWASGRGNPHSVSLSSAEITSRIHEAFSMSNALLEDEFLSGRQLFSGFGSK